MRKRSRSRHERRSTQTPTPRKQHTTATQHQPITHQQATPRANIQGSHTQHLMARAKRICPKTGCPHAADGRYCKAHNAAYEAERGTSTARGYGSRHQKIRAAANVAVQTGKVICARCHQPIQPGTPWALDHDDEDRGTYLGPSHVYCNNSAGGKRAHTT